MLKGKISVPAASRKYGFTQGEYREWADEFMRGGIDALKVNRKGLETEYRAEVKRLQAKIGELVMDNESEKSADCTTATGTWEVGECRKAVVGLHLQCAPTYISCPRTRRLHAAQRTTAAV